MIAVDQGKAHNADVFPMRLVDEHSVRRGGPLQDAQSTQRQFIVFCFHHAYHDTAAPRIDRHVHHVRTLESTIGGTVLLSIQGCRLLNSAPSGLGFFRLLTNCPWRSPPACNLLPLRSLLNLILQTSTDMRSALGFITQEFSRMERQSVLVQLVTRNLRS